MGDAVTILKFGEIACKRLYMESLETLNQEELQTDNFKALVYELAEMLEWDTQDIGYRHLFGGHLYTYKDTMFVKVYNGSLYFRIKEGLTNFWDNKGSSEFPLVNISKSGKRTSLPTEKVTSLAIAIENPVSNPSKRPSYFSQNNFWYSIPSSITEKNEMAELLKGSYLLCVKEDKEKARSNDLRKLPNITAAIKRMLVKADIKNITQLKTLGAVKSYRLIKIHYPKASYANLYALDAALQKKHVSLLSDSERNNLVRRYEGNITFTTSRGRDYGQCINSL
ncbi:TfoX/Sxy family DNA transformation protein [Aliivibrio fischeri]|nr:TfoX/Sxy family DNA transformation protein [Aliivibrio fischeri]